MAEHAYTSKKSIEILTTIVENANFTINFSSILLPKCYYNGHVSSNWHRLQFLTSLNGIFSLNRIFMINKFNFAPKPQSTIYINLTSGKYQILLTYISTEAIPAQIIDWKMYTYSTESSENETTFETFNRFIILRLTTKSIIPVDLCQLQ